MYEAMERGEPYTIRSRNGAETEVSCDEFRELVWLLWANALEQAPHIELSAPAKVHLWRSVAHGIAHLPDQAVRELAEAYRPRERPRANRLRPGLRAMFNVDSAETFVTEYWPDKLFLAHGPVGRLAGLVSYDFDALAQMAKHHTEAFCRTPEGKAIALVVQPGQERALYDAGFTIYFHNLSSPSLHEWVGALDAELGLVRGVTRVAAFASRHGTGLPPHYDQNDNFVCQARGAKRWRIASNTHVQYPTLGYTIGAKVGEVHKMEAPNGFPLGMPSDYQTVELRPGSVMFMPRGTWHDTETVEEESLHFNVQSGLPTWKDAIEYVLTQNGALYAEEWRAPISQLFDGDQVRKELEDDLKEKLRRLVEAVCDDEIRIDRNGFQKYIMSRPSRA
jgi:ribosomal protein L16 Arg81 hydroxylase